ncbi:MAG: alpha/beta hydrolase fold domain-containing protein [Planctomycetales bacterium]|nr:alpha/beta hydrolase fold domain-containing protein [Planctomycetales bacterium]
MLRPRIGFAVFLLVFEATGTPFSASFVTHAAEPSQYIDLWPKGIMPGESRADPSQPEQLVTSRRRTFDQYTNIAIPRLAVFLAPEHVRTGAAVLVCPGGGMQRLAYEHEGVEIADWLNPLGISVFVLKYRVPGPSSTALLDAQRAIGIMRLNASDFQIDPSRVGVMGFSAGGEVALLLSTHYKSRGYDAIDEADQLSTRPDCSCLIYPGGIVSFRTGQLRPDIAEKLGELDDIPPTFIVHAFPDASQNSLALGVELKKHGVPMEMHIYQDGGHGFGARDTALPLGQWKESYQAWIRLQGFFDPPFVSSYSKLLAAASTNPTKPQALSKLYPDVTLDHAYAIQRALVATQKRNRAVLGYKAGYVTKAAQQAAGLTGPATGVLYQDGKLEADEPVLLSLNNLGPSAIETELGFIVSEGLDISTRISTEKQVRKAFETIVPVIEVPARIEQLMQGETKIQDVVAANIGSRRVLVAPHGISPDDFDPASLSIQLNRSGTKLHAVAGDTISSGLWQHLIKVVNQLVDQGYTLRAGDLIIAGALGQVHPAEVGNYVADYGDLGKIEFQFEP